MAFSCIKFATGSYFQSLKTSFQSASRGSSFLRLPFSGIPTSTSRQISTSAARSPAASRKQFRGRMKGTASQGNQVSFGGYALQALEPAWVTSRQIEAGRRAIIPYARRGGKIWVRIFPDKSITGRPAETRMGKGKGAIKCMVSVVKPGRVIYEIGGVSESVAREAITIAASKMPIKTQFVTKA
ncbi:ribosomal protein L16 [Ranunculus cassubicifolius]